MLVGIVRWWPAPVSMVRYKPTLKCGKEAKCPFFWGGEDDRARMNQPAYWFLGDKGLGIQQGTVVWVGSPKSGQ